MSTVSWIETDIMKSIPFLQLIGSPIVAIIQAEAMAARATAEFIESIGFVKHADRSDENHYGELRTITFEYAKQDVNGREVHEEITLPLLSLIPIPMLQIKDAQLAFNIKVIDTDSSASTRARALDATRMGATRASDAAFSTQGGAAPVGLMAVYKPATTSSSSSKTESDMKVNINLVQSDMPAGLQQLFQIMENAATSRAVARKTVGVDAFAGPEPAHEASVDAAPAGDQDRVPDGEQAS
jgi:hypothetical protein